MNPSHHHHHHYHYNHGGSHNGTTTATTTTTSTTDNDFEFQQAPHAQSSTSTTTDEEDDFLTRMLLSFTTNQRMQITISEEKWDEVFSNLFANELLTSGASADDLKCLACAECVAALYFKLGIFSTVATMATTATATTESKQHNDPSYSHSLISRFVSGHFGSSSPYVLPLNSDMVNHFGDEHFIYSDFQVYLSDVQIPSMPTITATSRVPPIEMSMIQTFNTSASAIKRLNLKTGDLVFFKEEGLIGGAALKIQGGNFSRVSMVIRFPELGKKVFLLDAPSWYLTPQEAKTCKKKLLQQRIVTLDSVLMSGAFSRVAIRRLVKNSPSEKPHSTQIFASLQVIASEEDLIWNRIHSLFGQLELDYGPLWRFDVSSMFSGCFVALAYSQMGLLPSHETLHKTIMMTPSIWETQKLVDGYRLGEEETLHGKLMAAHFGY